MIWGILLLYSGDFMIKRSTHYLVQLHAHDVRLPPESQHQHFVFCTLDSAINVFLCLQTRQNVAHLGLFCGKDHVVGT